MVKINNYNIQVLKNLVLERNMISFLVELS